MSIRNQNWYNLQATRRYPLDENGTGLDDANAFIRDDILVDCHIRFPSTYGKYVYVQGLTVSTGLVTVVFGVSVTAGSAIGEPLAAVSIPKPVTANINYAVTALKPGVSGWVVFGPGVETNFVGRYTTVQQALVSPRCARSYRPLPVPTIGKIGLDTSLQGVVKILGQVPVRVRYDASAGAVIDGATKEVKRSNVAALVVELDPTQITENYNPLQKFLGPCAQRPESGTCPKPPIETINGIAPDCNGNIEIAFENFYAAVPFDDCGGIDVIHEKDLPALCNNTFDPPRQPQDDCCVADFEVATEEELQTFPANQRKEKLTVKTLDSGVLWRLEADLTTWTSLNADGFCSWPDPTNKIPDIVIDETPPTTNYPQVSIPACVDFATCAGNTKFTTQTGAFNIVSNMSPAACQSCNSAEINPTTVNTANNTLTEKNVYATAGLNALNIATFNNYATDWTIGKTVATELKIDATGGERNGGIVLNYQKRLNELGRLQTTFVAAVLDASRGQLRVLRYTDNSVTVESAVPLSVKPAAWYRLYVTPVTNGTSVAINVRAEELGTQNTVIANIVAQIAIDMYGPLVGAAGLFANKSRVYFNKFTIVN